MEWYHSLERLRDILRKRVKIWERKRRLRLQFYSTNGPFKLHRPCVQLRKMNRDIEKKSEKLSEKEKAPAPALQH